MQGSGTRCYTTFPSYSSTQSSLRSKVHRRMKTSCGLQHSKPSRMWFFLSRSPVCCREIQSSMSSHTMHLSKLVQVSFLLLWFKIASASLPSPSCYFFVLNNWLSYLFPLHEVCLLYLPLTHTWNHNHLLLPPSLPSFSSWTIRPTDRNPCLTRSCFLDPSKSLETDGNESRSC